MEIIQALLSNRILMSGVLGWAAAQVLKTIIFLAVNREFRLERLFGDGGMPSGHSATVTAVAASTGIEYGFDSAFFAIACILAIIVMHDAMGVRRETGKQAQVINELMEMFSRLGDTGISAEIKLKEFVGHTPLQVFAGLILGIIMALVFHYTF